MGKVIGIDLGTGNSCVAVMQHGQAKIIPNSEGGRTTPSVFAITKQGDKVVGQLAKRQATTNPKNTVYEIKRLIGQTYQSVKDQRVSYTIKSNNKGQAIIIIDDKQFSPQQISAQILRKMKETAQTFLGTEVTDAVITVPAYFGDDQRTATKDAGKIAGLNVLRVINEPTAAALSYGLSKEKDEKVVVVDFGSGTHDVSVLDISDGIIQVLSTNGDTHLGGTDIDNLIIDWVLSEFNKEQGIDLSKDPMAMQRIKQAAQKAKIDLSGQVTASINLPFITADGSGPKHLDMTLTKAKFQNMIEPILKRIIDPCKVAMADAKLKIGQIDQVLLVGGSTRIPAVQNVLKQFFGKELNKSLNPDEVVAMGAAIQGAILSGDEDVRDVLLLDVTPLSLGIETLGDVYAKIIDKNTTIPTKKSQVFSTSVDNQPAVTIKVLQGERPIASKNKLLGNFDLKEIPPAPRGMPQIEVSFDIDSNGIIHVSAKDMGTGKVQSIKIERSGKLDQSEIDKMIKDAELYADQDEAKKKLIELKNEFESMVNQGEKSLSENKDNIPQELYNKVNDVLRGSKEKQLETAEQYETQIKSLQESLQEIGKHIYQNSQQQQTTEQVEPEPQRDDGPIDAEFEVVE